MYADRVKCKLYYNPGMFVVFNQTNRFQEPGAILLHQKFRIDY